MKEEENELVKIAQNAPALKIGNQYSMDAARAVYSAIQSLIAAGKPPNSHSVPRVAENILVQSGAGTISSSDAGEQVKTAIIELAGAGKIEAHLEPYKDWLIKKSLEMATLNNKIFVVHGHDEGAREAVARFLEKIEFIPIILQEQPNQGRTIIEKFEDHAGEASFAVVLLTPDDVGGARAAGASSERPRQNVVFELGFFVGRLGRGKVCLLRRGDLEDFSDFQGVVYTEMDASGGWKIRLARELEAAGLTVDVGKAARA
jgi:predicted nucleotide-binding protein